MNRYAKPIFHCYTNTSSLFILLHYSLLLLTSKKSRMRFSEEWKVNSEKENPVHLRERDFLEATPGFEPGNQGFADPCLTTWLCRHMRKGANSTFSVWSGWRGSNSLPPPWQGGALPDELQPQIWCPEPESNQRHVDFQSTALPTELSGQIWRPGTGSNRRPLAWQASVLTSWTTGPDPNVVETTGLEPVTPCL